jgi:phosphopantothenoylcysteine synthetase/decarboxylase
MDRLLVGASGSGGVLNLPAYLAALRAESAGEVRVIMTPAAVSIMPPSTVALVCDEVFLDRRPPTKKSSGHIELARWGEMFVVLPATANVIGQAANGLGPNLLTTTILASPNPVIFFPNVHEAMWSKPAVRRNVEILRDDGHVVVEPEVASAYEVGSGEMRQSLVMPEPTEIITVLKELAESKYK